MADWADTDGDNVPDIDLNKDGVSDEEDRWGGLEGWFGHCHAWAPAAFSKPEPRHAVTVEGVTFEVADIKALIEATFEGGGSRFLGGRCEDREIERDSNGRVVDAQRECRDINSGAFHVILTNIMGRKGLSFVTDVAAGYQVWNHPVRDYSVTRQDNISLRQALVLLNRADLAAESIPDSQLSYPYNNEAVKFAHVEVTFRYVVESGATTASLMSDIDSYTSTTTYSYVLELNEQGQILGGEWISQEHPDFLWAPDHSGHDVWYGGQVVIRQDQVQRLIDLSQEPTHDSRPAWPSREYPE